MPPIMWWTFVLPVTWRFLLYERLNFIIFRSIFMKWQLFAWHLFAMLFQVFHSFLVKCCQQLSPFIDLHAHKEFLHFFRVLFFAYNKSGTSMQTVNSDEVLMSQIPFSFQGFYHNKKHVWQSKDELCICFNLNMLSYGTHNEILSARIYPAVSITWCVHFWLETINTQKLDFHPNKDTWT